jgi:hypothetical protein
MYARRLVAVVVLADNGFPEDDPRAALAAAYLATVGAEHLVRAPARISVVGQLE